MNRPAALPSPRRRRGRAATIAAIVLACAIAPAAPPFRPSVAAGGTPPEVKQGFIARYVGKPAPAFSLRDLQGKTVGLGDFRGKVVLLNFWFSACFPCRQETPDLIQLYRLHKDRGLVVLGINTDALVMGDPGGAALKRFLAQYPIPYPVLKADMKMYRDYGSAPIQPISFLIDRQGKVSQVFWGARPGALFDRAVRPLLAAAPGR
ncbi:MAG: peroxiredoxin family protein [Candidatus Polarisedimenticolia bacterium]